MIKLNLRVKFLLSTTVFLLCFFALEILVSQTIFLNSYLDLEKKESIEALKRAQVVLNKLPEDIKVSDWSVWDESYRFVQDGNKEFAEGNLQNLGLQNLDINGIYYIATSGAVIYEKTIDFKTGEEIPTPSDLHSILSTKNIITYHEHIQSKRNGIIRLSNGLLFFACAPILKSDGTGPAMGNLVFARYLDKDLKKHFEDTSSTKIEVYDYYSDSLPEYVSKAKAGLISNEFYEIPMSSEDVGSFTIIKDYEGKPAYILQANIKRDIYNQGKNSIIGFLVIFAGISLMSLIFAVVIVSVLVLSKISKLNRDVSHVSDPNNSQNRLDVKGSDEFSSLALNINKMLDQISKSREDLEKFKLAIENTSDHITMTDPQGNVIYANKVAEDMTGYSLEEMKKSTPKLWGGQMPKEFYEKLWDTIRNKKQSFAGEVMNKKKTGELYPVELRISPILDEKGNIKLFVSLERDISSEKKLEENLIKQNEEIAEKVELQTREIKEEQDRLFKILESMPTGIFVLDYQGKPYYMNSEAKRLMGKGVTNVSTEELSQAYKVYKAGTNTLYPNKDLPLVKAYSEGKAVTVRDIEIRQGEKTFALEVSSAPIYNSEGKIVFAIAAFKDITEEKIAERSKEEFFSIASHELRTPLTAIRGNTALIKQYYQDQLNGNKDLNEMVDDIHESSVRLIQIVNDFLNVSRLEQGKIEYKFENFDLVELIKNKIEEINSLAKQKNLIVALESSVETIPNVYSDKNRLGEVLLNLLGNAIHYTDKGKIIVKTQISGGFVRVYVSDTGRGVSEENKKLLFRKFQQASESILTRDTTKGTGLGLYISRLMVEQMGGEIHLESSEENKGSIFSFVVPVAKQIL